PAVGLGPADRRRTFGGRVGGLDRHGLGVVEGRQDGGERTRQPPVAGAPGREVCCPQPGAPSVGAHSVPPSYAGLMMSLMIARRSSNGRNADFIAFTVTQRRSSRPQSNASPNASLSRVIGVPLISRLSVMTVTRNRRSASIPIG